MTPAITRAPGWAGSVSDPPEITVLRTGRWVEDTV